MTSNERSEQSRPESAILRRRFLTGISGIAALGVAGCSGDGTGDPTDTAGQTQIDGETPTPATDTVVETTESGDSGTGEQTSDDTDEATDTDRSGQIDPAYDGWPMFALDVANTGHATELSGPTAEVDEQWDFQTDERFESSPAVANGIVYVGSEDGYLYALNAKTGDELWSFETGDSVDASPTVVDGVVYVTSDEYVVYALNAETGDQQWNFELDESVGNVAPVGKPPSPAVANGTVFVGNPLPNTITLHAIDAETGDQQWTFAPVDKSDIGDETYGAMARTSPAVAEDTVYIGDNDIPGHLYALDAESGDIQWENTEITVNSEPTVANGLVYVGTQPDHEVGGVIAFEASTGEEAWSFDIDNHVASSPAATADMVYFGTDTSKVYALDATDGTEQWSYEAGDVFKSSPAVANGTVYIGSHDHSIYALDAESGSEVWTYEIAGSLAQAHIVSSPAVANGTVFVGSEGMFALTD